MTHLSRFVAAIGCAAVLGLAATPAEASVVSFSLTNTQGSASSDTDVTLEDVLGGVKFSFKVNDPTNTADIVAVYFDFVAGAPPTDLKIDGVSIGGDFSSSPVVSGAALNTKNVVAGNIGQIFDLGLAIGSTGSGVDFFSDFMFTLTGTGLDVSAFLGQTFAVRGQSVGPPPSGGGESSKEYGTAPPTIPPPPPTCNPSMPEPVSAVVWACLAAAGALSGRRIG